MTNKKRLGVAIFLVALALAALGVLWFVFNNPTPKPPSLINITRNEYEEAYNRWQQKGVVKYTVTTREVTASSDCRASTKVQQGQPMITNGEEGCRDRNQYRNVEQLFAAIDKQLQAEQNSSEQDRLTRWSVEFDQEIGYPLKLAIESVPGAPATVMTSTTTVERMDSMQVRTTDMTVTP